MSIHIVINELQSALDQKDYRIHCDVQDWGLAEPIIINSAEDIRSRVDWQTSLESDRWSAKLMALDRRIIASSSEVGVTNGS